MAVTVLSTSCRDWDAFDPRLAQGGNPTSSTTTGDVGGRANEGGGGSGAEGGNGGAPSVGGADVGGAGVGGSGGAPTQTAVYTATVADCIDPLAPDPDVCKASVGGFRFTVDIESGGPKPPGVLSHAYLRFDFDDAFEGAVIDSVSLELQVPNAVDAKSNQSGQLWEVVPFDREDLYVAAPAKVGTVPLQGDQGATSPGDLVHFDVPTSLVVVNGRAHFGVLPVSSDGVDYFNTAGDVPPKLRVTFH